MLGLVCDLVGDTTICRFIPTSPFRARPGSRSGWRAVDSRHGRVLLYRKAEGREPFRNELRVWCPVSGEELALPKLPWYPRSWSAAVQCVAAASVPHHLDCYRVGTDSAGMVLSSVYSSADGDWSAPVAAAHLPLSERIESVPPVLVENALYSLLQVGFNILRYDLGSAQISLIERPPSCSDRIQGRAVLMSLRGYRLGFAAVEGRNLCSWAMDVGIGSDEKEPWVQQSRPTRIGMQSRPDLIGAASGVGVLFLWTPADGICAVKLKSGKVIRKVPFHKRCVSGVVPYLSYCIPVGQLGPHGGDMQ